MEVPGTATPPAAQRPSPPPVLALVGRPNVGKSTLFNRLTRSRRALVAPMPGVTRDRREQEAQYDEFRFRLVDTGGLGFAPDAAFSEEIAAQVYAAIASADLVWLVLDGAEGLNPYDAELFRALRKHGKPVLAVANKADNPARREAAVEFHALGAERIYSVSALHGAGVREALEASAELVPGMLAPPAPTDLEATVRVAFVGRPNAGKSSLVNRILGAPRQIVSEIPGTTREAVEIPFRTYGQDYMLVDTAGIRRRSRTKEYLEKLSVLNALAAMEHADVVVLVVDAAQPVAEQDARIAGYVLEKRRGLVIAMNKWDLLTSQGRDPKAVEADIAHALRFADFAPRVRLSALTGEGLERLFKDIRGVAREFTRQIQTTDLNRVLQAVVRQTPPPSKGRSASKVFYGTQTGTRPPAFRFFTNHPESIPVSYTRFMEHQLRHHFGLRGVPIALEWRGRDAEQPPGGALRQRRRKARAARPEPGKAPAAAQRRRG
jgi:GTP-binding protein